MVLRQFANQASTTVSTGGTNAPSSGTSQTVVVASSTAFPAAVTGTSQFNVADPAAPSELITVTNTSGTTWTVTRGAEGTTPVTHTAGFTVYQVTSAADLGATAALYGPVVNILTYGASASSSDNGPAINSAIAALTSGHGIVLVPPGQYNFTTQINLGGAINVKIMGTVSASGATNTSLMYTGTGSTSAINATGSQAVVFENLFIEYNNTGFTGYLIDYSGTGSDTALGIISRCYVGSAGGSPYAAALVCLNHANSMKIIDSYFFGGVIGILGMNTSGSYTNKVTIDNCYFHDNGTHIQDGCQVWMISNNTFEPCTGGTPGVYLQTQNGAAGTSFLNNWMGDITASTGSQISWFGTGLVIEGNYIGANTGVYGITISASACDGIYIAGNSFATTSGINFGSTTSNTGVTIVSNYFGLASPIAGTIPASAIIDVPQHGTGYGMVPTAAGIMQYAPGTLEVGGVLVAPDTSGTDIAPLGTQAAGSTGKFADAGHVHPAATYGANLITNPDFASGSTTGWSTSASGTNFINAGATLTAYSGDSADGTGTCGQIVTTSSTFYEGVRYSLTSGMAASTVYAFSVYVKLTAGSQALQIICEDLTNGIYGPYSTTINPAPGTWTLLTTTITTGATTPTSLRCAVRGPSSVVSTFLISDAFFATYEAYATLNATAALTTNLSAETTRAEAAELVLTNEGQSIFSPMNYGAAGNGTTDDSIAVKAAFAAAAAVGGTVDLGTYTFKTTSAIPLASYTYIRGRQGNNDNLGGIVNTASDMFTLTGGAYLITFEQVNLTASDGHVFNAGTASVSFFNVMGCVISQQSTSHCIWYQTGGLYINCIWAGDSMLSCASGATVSPMQLGNGTSGTNDNIFEKLVIQGQGATVPFFLVSTVGGYGWIEELAFRDITFETCTGGGISLVACQNVVIENCQNWDIPALRTDTSLGSTSTVTPTTVGDTAAVTGDLGKAISGPGIPSGTYITLVNAGTGYTISQNVTATASGLTFIVGGPSGNFYSFTTSGHGYACGAITITAGRNGTSTPGSGFYDIYADTNTTRLLTNSYGWGNNPVISSPANQTTTINNMSTGSPALTAPSFTPTGDSVATGSVAATRYLAATTGGAPSTGTYKVGDVVPDQTGALWICTATPHTFVAAGSGPNVAQLISSQVLSGTAASITFSAIPSTYTQLRLVCVGASNTAAEATRWYVRVNADTGSHYDNESIPTAGSGTGVVGQQSNATQQWLSASGSYLDLPGASATSGIAGILEVVIPAYAGTTLQKVGLWRSGFTDGATGNTSSDNGLVEQLVSWRSSAAITSLTAAPVAGSLIAGTAAYLYGS